MQILWVAAAGILLVVLVWLTRMRVEAFNEDVPDPAALFKQARQLLDKYDRPELWQHALFVKDKDPGQLARLQLGIQNESP